MSGIDKPPVRSLSKGWAATFQHPASCGAIVRPACANDNDAMQDEPFLEVKRYPDGRVSRFECLLVAYDSRVAVVRYVYTRDFVWQGYLLPRGGFTRAWYWRSRRYLLYRMYGPDGSHILDRFDVIDPPRLRRSGVEYRDLYLDVWIDRCAVARIDDEDELDAAVAVGRITANEAVQARRIARSLLRDHALIIDGAQIWLKSRLAS